MVPLSIRVALLILQAGSILAVADIHVLEKEKIDRYAILGKTAILPCIISDTSSPARNFYFSRNNQLLADDKKYHQAMDVMENIAYLMVYNVQSEDLGEYHCEASNDRGKISQLINLQEANPPEELKVSIETVDKYGIAWFIETNANDKLPVLAIEIEAVRKDILDEELGNGEMTEEKIWQSDKLPKSNTFLKSINVSGLYDIGSLVNSPIVFRFRAENAAGFGSRTILIASTNKETNKEIVQPKKPNPPGELQVSLETTSKHGMVWRVQTNSNDTLPVKKIEIQTLLKAILDQEILKGEKDEEKIWRAKANTYHMNITDSGLYDVGRLRADHEYVFRFRAKSEAGFGPRSTTIAFAIEQAPTQPPNTSAAPLTICLALFFTVVSHMF